MEKAWKPLVALVRLILEWMVEFKRSVTGEDKFIPVARMEESQHRG
jgi:hypothetical protein